MQARRSSSVWLALAFGLVVVGGAAAWLTLHLHPVTPVVPASPAPPAPAAAPAQRLEPTLPPKPVTDAQARALLESASARPEWRSWLGRGDLLTRIVATVDGLSQGVVPRTEIGAAAPEQPFAVQVDSQGYVIDPKSFERYNTFADVIGSLDAKTVVRAYTVLLPLLRVAYHVFGYPNRDFDTVVHQALQQIETAPETEEELRVVPGQGALYKFADPKLEALDAVQKELLRMGPRNMTRIQAKAGEIDALLRPRAER